MKKRTGIILLLVLIVLGALAFWAFTYRGHTDVEIGEGIARITVTSPAFEDNGLIPEPYTGNGEDISPPFALEGIADGAVSIAIIMDDLDIPVVGSYTHWTIWNIPPANAIPEGIAHGETVSALGGATQGMGYGEHRYRGPKPPFGTHRYQFHFFVLDTLLQLEASAGKAELLDAIEGHVLQYGSITGWYPRAE